MYEPLATKSLAARGITLVVVIVPFLATILAIATLWQGAVVPVDLVLLLGLYLLTGLGITIGYHRFATHRSFQSGPIVTIFLLALGSMAMEGGVLPWVATHWKHHGSRISRAIPTVRSRDSSTPISAGCSAATLKGFLVATPNT
jgi:stearoyl-CoA desaturase (delta-9 desaturase)